MLGWHLTKGTEWVAHISQSQNNTAPQKMVAYPSPKQAWFVLGILVIGSLVAFVDRQVVAIVVEPMKADLGVGDTQIGWLYGVFSVFYAIAAVPIAWLADHKSRKHLIAAGIFLWSFMTIACGLTRQFWFVLLARVGVGVGEATLTPATTSLIGDYFPRHQIPLALSIFQTGAIMGSGLAFIIGGYVLGIVQDANPMVLPVVGELQPWQQTFVYVGLPGFALAVLFLFIREPRRRPVVGREQSEGASFAEVREFYKQNLPTLALHHFGFLSLVLMGYAFVFWSVTYFVRVHGIDAATASQTFGWIFLIAGPIGPIVVAFLARKLYESGRYDANILAGLIGGCLAIPVIVIIQFAPSATWAFIMYAPALMLINSPFGIAAAALPMITPAHMRAQVAAIYMLIGSLGMMIGPPLAGAFNEFVFPGPEGVRYSMMTLTCVFGLIGVSLLWLCRKHYAESLRRAEALEA